MVGQPTSDFDVVAGSFSEYDQTLRGHIRYIVVRRNLAPYLGQKQLRVLDVGGGSGPDAVWLASLGHSVTIVELSREQRLYAERRFNFFLSPEQRARITMVEGDLSDLAVKPASFDLVLCHGVAMYQKHARKFIVDVIGWVKPGGIVSILEKGYYGAEARLVHALKFDQLENLHSTQKVINNLGMEVHAFTPDALETIIESAGAEVEHWSGVRVMTDRLQLKLSDFTTAELDTIIEAEYSQGNHPQIRAQGQMLHFIAQAG